MCNYMYYENPVSKYPFHSSYSDRNGDIIGGALASQAKGREFKFPPKYKMFM
jgi:hypothetical protein